MADANFGLSATSKRFGEMVDAGASAAGAVDRHDALLKPMRPSELTPGRYARGAPNQLHLVCWPDKTMNRGNKFVRAHRLH